MAEQLPLEVTSVAPVIYKNQPVLTLAMIDQLHQRSKGTAKRNYTACKKHLREGEDFYLVDSTQKNEFRTFGINVPPRGLIVLTQTGYLMLVKSFQDDLAWVVQRHLVQHYFNTTQPPAPAEPENGIETLTRLHYMSQPVVTFEMIDSAHNRNAGCASKTFHRDAKKGLLTAGVDFFKVGRNAKGELDTVSSLDGNSTIVLSVSGYLQVAAHYKEAGSAATRKQMLKAYFGVIEDFSHLDNNQLAAMHEASRLLASWLKVKQIEDQTEQVVQMTFWNKQVQALAKAQNHHALSTQNCGRQIEAEQLLINRVNSNLQQHTQSDFDYVNDRIQLEIRELGWAKRWGLLERRGR